MDPVKQKRPRVRGLGYRVGALACAAGSALVLGCATLGPGSAERARGAASRDEGTPEYDFLMAQLLEFDEQIPEAAEAYARAAAKDPDSPFLQRKLAELAARQDRLDEALEHARRAHELEPSDPQARVLLGKLHYLNRDLPSAERVLRDESGQPASADAAVLLYQIEMAASRYGEAVDVASWLVAQDPGAARAYQALATAYDKLGLLPEAAETLRDALEIEPANLALLSDLARTLRKREDREGEIEIYRKVLALYPHHHATLRALADAQTAQGDIDGAVATVEEIAEYYPGDIRFVIHLATRILEVDPEQHEIAFFLGLVRRRLGDEEGAIELFRSISPHHENYPEAQMNLAALYDRRGDYASALAAVREVQAHEPSRALDLYAATLRSKSGDFDGAVTYLETLLAQQPDDDEIFYNLGVLYGEARRYDEALRYMQLALERNPDNASALNYIGYTRAERGENLDEAEAMIIRALELRPDDGYITDSLGWVYYMRGLQHFDAGREKEGRELVERALQELQRAAELTGGDPVIAEHIGDAYLLLDRRELALEMFREAIDLEPSQGEQPNLLEKYESLQQELGEP